ncbi:ShlB/FhaC/HecB family hemolysin secretion/activation protein [Comamonas sp. GB3 AK4-5]|uniref:ShlB/FhaC/HecB family hemolysin secretion/activation protein n=1 Tax=Comamonas sp. GB3 AK4-5 TaxID=3231487 RepID=UPI00351ED1B3
MHPHSLFHPEAKRTAAQSAVLPLAALLLTGAVAHAQSVPDAGSLQRETERSLQAPHLAPAPQAAPATRPMAADAKAVRVTVQRIAIEGATLIPTAELEALVASQLGQSLTLAELEHAAQTLAEHYRQRGWYARVYLPQQDVTGGTVRIQVLEGRYSGSSVQHSGERADAAAVQATVTQRLQPGQPLSSADLERGLLIANDLPGIAASGTLQAGQAQGDTALVVSVQDTAFITGDAGLSNHGIKSTGRVQASGGLALNNMNGSGDQLALRLLAAQDIRSALVRYSLPLGRSGLRLAAHASTLDYQLGGSYKALDAEGKAHTGGLSLSYPLIRQAERNLSLSAGYEHRRYDDDMQSLALRRHRINALTLGISGDLRDSLGGGGISWGGVSLASGRLNLNGIASDAAQDAVTAKTQGSYTKLAWNLARVQSLGALGPGWQVQASASGQFASGNLASSERMTLGGPSQVRAYPVNEASGDQGLLLKLELQKELGQGWQAVAFYDAGHIRQHKNTWAGWSPNGQPNRYSLQGAGLGVNWRTQNWQLAASIAAPIGSNRGEDAQGRNNDGSKASSVRGWLSLTRLF